MLYWGKGTPDISTLGDVFLHVCDMIESDDGSIVDAFEACDLDLDNPFHWGYLLRILCDLHFSSRKKSKLKLTNAFIERLQQDRVDILKKRPDANQMEQATLLIKQLPDRYADYKNANSLRRIFPKEQRKRRTGSKKGRKT
jgi:hypothetical protein